MIDYGHTLQILPHRTVIALHFPHTSSTNLRSKAALQPMLRALTLVWRHEVVVTGIEILLTKTGGAALAPQISHWRLRLLRGRSGQVLEQ